MKNRMKRGGIFLLVMIMAMAINVGSTFAQDDYDPIQGSSNAIKIKKVLELNGATVVPAHDVTFTASFIKGSSNPNTLTIEGSNPTLTMRFSSATPINSDKATITENLDFSGVKFSKPGVYRFQITETIEQGKKINRKDGTESFYNLDVYVENDGIDSATGKEKLKITAYVVYRGSTQAKYNPGQTSGATLEFNNVYDNYRFYVTKSVTGNQGDKSKEFTIWVQLKGTTADDTITVTGVSGTPKGAVGTSSNPTMQALTATPLSARGGGTSSILGFTLRLKDTDKVLIEGLNSNVSYRVHEDDSSGVYGSTGYTVSYKPLNVDSNSASTTMPYPTKINNTNGGTVTVTNNKSGTIPTGIFINNWPYIAVVLIAIAACIVFIRRRKARYEREEDL